MTINARINIDAVIQSRYQTNEPFRPHAIENADFHKVSDFNSYLADNAALAATLWDYLEARRAEMKENFVQLDIRVDNVTHTTSIGKGVIPLPKAHISNGFTGSEATSAALIEKFLNDTVADLKQKARY